MMALFAASCSCGPVRILRRNPRCVGQQWTSTNFNAGCNVQNAGCSKIPRDSRRASGALEGNLLGGNLDLINAIITIYPIPFMLLMAILPRAQVTKTVLSGTNCFVPLGLLYTLLLVTSWTPDSFGLLLPGDLESGISGMLKGKPQMLFIPCLSGICQLLSAPMASVSAWAHLQFITLFCARWIWLDGLLKNVATIHSIVLSAILPPLGFLSHIFTCFFSKTPAASADSQDNSGTQSGLYSPA